MSANYGIGLVYFKKNSKKSKAEAKRYFDKCIDTNICWYDVVHKYIKLCK